MDWTTIKDSSNSFFSFSLVDQIVMFLNYHSRTPGSRQPSPAEEHHRLHGLDPSLMNVGGFSQPHMMQHMMNNHDQQQMNSSFHHQHQQHHPMGHPVMNGMQVQVTGSLNKTLKLQTFQKVV